MMIVLVLISLLIVATGGVLVIQPEFFINKIRQHADSRALHVFSVVGRILFGAALLIYAEYSKAPWLLQLLGIVAVLAGFVFALFSRERFSGFVIKMIDQYGQLYGRIAGVIIVLFGSLLLFLVT